MYFRMCFKFTAILRQNRQGRYFEVKRMRGGYDTIELYFRTMGAVMVLLRKKRELSRLSRKF
jgi:hypothetical protein